MAKTLTASEKKISAFCARHGIDYEWQALQFDGRRAVVPTMDRIGHEALMKKARRLHGVRVTEWRDRYMHELNNRRGGWNACIYLQDADDAARVDDATKTERERNQNWLQVYHDIQQAGYSRTDAARRAEALYPTPV